MLSTSAAFSSFSTDDIDAARHFYGEVLGLTIEAADAPMGPMLFISHAGGGRTLIYEKDDHEAATHTVLMFPVDDIDAVVAELASRGVELEQLEWTGADGVARDPGGAMPATAWLKDPAGNWLSIMEEA